MLVRGWALASLDIFVTLRVRCPQQKKSKWPGRRDNAPGPGRPDGAWPTAILSHPRPVAVQSAPGFLVQSEVRRLGGSVVTTVKCRAAAYIRVSTKHQAEHGASLEEQQLAIQAHCDSNDLEVDYYIDEGISGRKVNRPEFNRMLEGVKANLYDWVIIWKLDRVSRRPSIGYRLKDALDKTQTEIYSIIEGHAVSNRFMFGVWLLMAEQESEDKRVRSRMGARARAKKGKVNYLTCFGYRMGADGTPEICESEAEVVRRIYGDYTSGVPTMKIVDSLAAQGILTRKGFAWGAAAISGLVKRTEYIGEGYFGKAQYKLDPEDDTKHRLMQDREDWIAIRYPPIVDRNTWDAAQGILKRNARLRKAKGYTAVFPLRHVLWCGSCGCRYTPRTVNRNRKVMKPDGSYDEKRNKRGRAYDCRVGRYGRNGCPKTAMGANKIEELVWEKVRAVLEHPDSVKAMLNEKKREYEESGSLVELGRARARLKAVREERQRVLTAFQKGYLPESELDIRMRSIGERQEMYEIGLDRMKRQLEDHEANMAKLDDFLERAAEMSERLDGMTIEEKSDIIDALISRVTVLDRHLIEVELALLELVPTDGEVAWP